MPPFSDTSGLREEEETVRDLTGSKTPFSVPNPQGGGERARDCYGCAREEERRTRIPLFRSAPCAVDRVMGDPANFAAMQAEVGQFASAHVGKLAHRFVVKGSRRNVLACRANHPVQLVPQTPALVLSRGNRHCHVFPFACPFVLFV